MISACRIFTSVSNPLGQLLTGFLLERYGVMPALIGGWIALTFMALTITLNPQLRHAGNV